MDQSTPLLPNLFTSVAPWFTSFAKEEVKLCCSFEEDLNHLKKDKIFPNDLLKYVEKKYLEKISEDNSTDMEATVVEVICGMKSAICDMEDIIYGSYHLKEQIRNSSFHQKVIAFFSMPNPTILRADLIQKMKFVRKELRRVQDLISKTESQPISQCRSFSTSNLFSSIIGRNNDMRIIKELLIETNREEISIVPIFGPVGLGKTSIAALLYFDPWVIKEFDLYIWIDLSMGSVDVEDIARKLILKAGGLIGVHMNLSAILKCILNSKRCFIVLDGLWGSEEKVFELKHLLMTGKETRSKIVVTTPSQKTANMIATTKPYRLPALSEDNCREIFQKSLTHPNIEMFEKYGKDIVSRCEGIPLVAKFLASVVNTGTANDQEWEGAKDKPMWKLEKDVYNSCGVGPMPMFRSFRRIYCNLSACSRKCFVYCSVFLEGSYLDKQKLTRQWMALELIESRHNTLPPDVVAHLFIEDLKSIFFFDDTDNYSVVIGQGPGAYKEKLRMHTLAYNFARSIGSRETLVLSQKRETLLLSGDEKMKHTDNYCAYRCAYICMSALKSIDKKEWPVKARALILEADETDLKLVTKLIAKNTYLRVLDLRGCCSCIRELPSCVFLLKHLMYLDASGLHIQEISLPNNCLQKLETLDLSDTKLQELPSCISSLKMLSYLSLRGCSEILQLPPTFGMFPNLKFLDLSFCVGLRELPESFDKLRNIDLDLSGCNNAITTPERLDISDPDSVRSTGHSNEISNNILRTGMGVTDSQSAREHDTTTNNLNPDSSKSTSHHDSDISKHIAVVLSDDTANTRSSITDPQSSQYHETIPKLKACKGELLDRSSKHESKAHYQTEGMISSGAQSE